MFFLSELLLQKEKAVAEFLACLQTAGHTAEDGENKIAEVVVTSQLAKSLWLSCLPTVTVTQPDSSRKKRRIVNFYCVQGPTCK